MSNLSDIRSSKFLKKEDVGRGVLVTVKEVTKENIAKEGADPELKFCIWFQELDKPLVLNSTNGQMIAKITTHEDDIEQNWPGTKIVLYTDDNVSFAGKLVGGIRVRAPKNSVKPKPAPAVTPTDDDISDLPF